MFSKSLEIREHAGPVYQLAFDGEFLYSTGADKFITRWNPFTGEQDKFAIRLDFPSYSIEVVEQFLIAGCNNGSLHIFDLKNRVELKHFTQHKSAIFYIRYNSFRKELYVGDADGNLSVWDFNEWKLKIILPLGCGKIRDIGFDENNGSISLACQDGFVRVLDTKNFNEISKLYLHNDGVTSVLPWDDNVDFSGGKDAYVRIRDKKINKVVIGKPLHKYSVYRMLKFDNKLITASRDKSIKVWSEQLEPIQKIEAREGGHAHSVNDIIAINSSTIASCGDDRRIILWNWKG